MDVLAVGSDVWVRDDKEGWLKARVTKTDGPKVTVKTEQEDERVVDGAQCPLQNSDGRSGVEVRSTFCRRHVAQKRFMVCLAYIAARLMCLCQGR